MGGGWQGEEGNGDGMGEVMRCSTSLITVFSSPPSPMLVCAVRKKASARRRVGFTPWVGHALPGKTP